ncbi:MAG: glycoside hydrolase family 18 protein [Candidatus Chromulinivorax sp.]|nr:glycoside hydrolase family 18 protein [Candidatus Chromulinivorax sp.]
MKFTENRIIVFLIIGACCLVAALAQASDQICPSPLPKQYQNVQAGNVVSAYFGNWDVYGGNSYQIDRIAAVADKLTHVVYGFMKPDEVNGTCKPHDVWADIGAYDGYQTKIGGNFAKMIALKKQFPHLKILLSVGGGTYNKQLLAIAKDKEKLMKFAQSCVDMLDFYEHSYISPDKEIKTNHLTYEGLFDGLDIDWEWSPSQLTADMAQAYTKFIHEVKRLLNLRNKNSMLTVALQVTPKIYSNLELEKIAQYIHWFHVMAYDFYGPHSGLVGFNAPICDTRHVYSVDGAVQALMQRGVSPDKMVLGLPLYGYVYPDSAGYKSTIKNKDTIKSMSYQVMKTKYLANPDYKKGWNTYEKSSSAYNSKDRVFISYDSKESLMEKTKFAKNKKMQGVVLWRLSGDDAQHSMVNGIVAAMKN